MHNPIEKYKDVIIARSKREDYERIAEIYNIYIKRGGATMAETPHSSSDIEEWIIKMGDREGLFSMKRGNEYVGWGIIKRYSDREGYRLTCETSVYLFPNERGNGYGSAFKRFLIEVCKAWDYKHLVAKIFAENEESIAYNLKLGYTIVGRQEKVGYKNGKWIDIVIMQYIT